MILLFIERQYKILKIYVIPYTVFFVDYLVIVEEIRIFKDLPSVGLI